MADYEIDPERSTATAVRRPPIETEGSIPARVSGEVSFDDEDPTIGPSGTIEVTIADRASRPVAIDLAKAAWDLGTDERGAVVLHGRATRPAGAFGLGGPPLLNPTVQLSWRLVLVPR
jgi:hypothetical protein